MGRIYGANYSELNERDIHQDFNGWAEKKQFVLGDEVTGSNQRKHADYLKKMITQTQISINQKYIPSYVIDDCINYLFTSNHPDSFFLEDADRRFLIVDVNQAPMEHAFYKNLLISYVKMKFSYVFGYLLKVDLKSTILAAC